MKALALLVTTLILAPLQLRADLPPNRLDQEDDRRKSRSGINEVQFYQTISRIEMIYKPIIETHGGQLEIEGVWTDSTVNAYAHQNEKLWHIQMYGGLARREEVTLDGFVLVICHELGHHLGGYPFYEYLDWAASEGEADYFATQACARHLWKDDTQSNARSRETVDVGAKSSCDLAWSGEADRDLCYRVSMAGYSLARLLAKLRDEDVSFNLSDETQVHETYTGHPEAQCRLDTYLAGGRCSVDFEPSLIPGKNHPEGQTSLAAEQEAFQYSCSAIRSESSSWRPRCWFKALQPEKF